MDWAKTTARRYKKHLSFGIWCDLYQRFYGIWLGYPSILWIRLISNEFINIDHITCHSCEWPTCLCEKIIVWYFSKDFIRMLCTLYKNIWVRSRNCGCLVTWFCYQLIAKPGNKTAAVSWPDPYVLSWWTIYALNSYFCVISLIALQRRV